jgi:hypothetical protein
MGEFDKLCLATTTDNWFRSLKSSRYLPVLDAITSRDSSMSSNEQRKKDPKNKAEPTKRRATMNSRVAYDEDELIRRAIEESREMGTLGKRSREDVDDQKAPVKRQRTASSSSDTASKRSQSPVIDEIPRVAAKGKQILRGAAAKNNREREAREKQKDQAAAARAEAANKRNARSERRRGEGNAASGPPTAEHALTPADSPPPSPSVSPSKANAKESKSKGGTPTPTSNPRIAKGKRGPVKRGRLGRNQYTKARDEREAALAAGADSDTPMRDFSHDRIANGLNGNNLSPQGRGRINGESGKSSKAKTHPARTSLNEMKRRVAAILEFVGQLQTQTSRMAGSKTGSGSGSKGGTPAVNGDSAVVAGVAGLVKAVQAASDEVNAALASSDETENVKGGPVKLNLRDDGDFRDMGSVEMMETLTRELVGWQSVYGVYSR